MAQFRAMDQNHMLQIPGIARRARRRFSSTNRLSSALQGGGAFGAFTWGVLDRLLEEEIAFDTISGASSGAINALLLTAGMQAGGPIEARERLEHFWHEASELARLMDATRGLGLFPRVFSPYQLNPLGLNPLRDLLREAIDFERIPDADIALLIATTRVSDGALRIFRNDDVSVDAVLASAALPMVHHAIEIENEWYWDGGYAANPPLISLAVQARARDVLVVQIVPTSGADLPRTPREINGRLAQMAFNRPLMQELDMIAELKSARGVSVFGDSMSRKLRRLRLHHIKADETLPAMPRESALNLDWSFLTRLRDAGRDAAEGWLAHRSAGRTQ
jgi:NTE family protein